MPEVFKRKEFAKWQEREGLADTALCRAVQEMRSGLVDAEKSLAVRGNGVSQTVWRGAESSARVRRIDGGWL